MLNDLFGALSQIAAGPAPVINRTEINGFTVSTVNTCDAGPETAILNKVTTTPVERYTSIDQAKKGHDKWVDFIKNSSDVIKVTKLGYGSYIDAEKVTMRADKE